MTRQESGRGRKMKPGRITFVGSGPGDPGLLTARAHSVLVNAALVFTDPDVPEAVLSLVGAHLPPIQSLEVPKRPPTIQIVDRADPLQLSIAAPRSGRAPPLPCVHLDYHWWQACFPSRPEGLCCNRPIRATPARAIRKSDER